MRESDHQPQTPFFGGHATNRDTKLYPHLEPFRREHLDMPNGHRIYVEQCGNPNGLPVVVLHGGPGGGCSPGMRRFFDPKVYRIILFDQRGCGRSHPHSSLENNTTWDLVEDIERIRQHLGVEKWVVFGGSWGSTLSLIYAQSYPENVRALVLRGIFLMTRKEVDWFYNGGAAHFRPEQWQMFADAIPEDERHDYVAAYYRRLTAPDIHIQTRFARLWAGWEASCASMQSSNMAGPDGAYARAFSRLEAHYFVNNGWLEDGQILRNIDRLQNIEGYIVQGRYDLICPPASAYALSRAWPKARLQMVDNAGHALSETGITRALIAATDRIAKDQ